MSRILLAIILMIPSLCFLQAQDFYWFQNFEPKTYVAGYLWQEESEQWFINAITRASYDQSGKIIFYEESFQDYNDKTIPRNLRIERRIFFYYDTAGQPD